MVAYSFYESDNRVRRYAETLVQAGYAVDAFALRQPGQARRETINGVRVYRIQKRRINEKGRLAYLFRLLAFFATSSCWLVWMHIRRHYRLIHVHSVPDFEVFAAVIPKLFDARVILDIHDLVPEFYIDKFQVRPDSLLVRALKLTERLCCRFSDHVIVSNDLWREQLIARSVPPSRCTTILNYPVPLFFEQQSRVASDAGRWRMIYPGSLLRHQGVDTAIKACRQLKESIQGFQFHILGKGADEVRLRKLVQDLHLEGTVFFEGFLTLEECAARVAQADIGIVPKLAVGFGNDAFSTKILEFMAIGIPVVAADTRIDRHYFSDGSVHFFRPGDAIDLATKVLFLKENHAAREKQLSAARALVATARWDRKKDIYLDILRNLNENNRANKR